MSLKGWGMLFLFGIVIGAMIGGAIAEGHTGTGVRSHPQSSPSQLAKANIPAGYLKQYRAAGKEYRIPWTVLAGIGKVESDHGRSSAPGVRSGVNRFGCCAGPMQFNIRNGPRTTWDAYGHGGSPYKPEHAIPAAARLLVANGARRNLDRAIYSYNHSWAYVANVKAWAARYRSGDLNA